MGRIDILVILVNYEGTQLTDECIKSINNSSISVDIMVIDNNSSDNSISEVCKFYNNVIFKKLDENIGFAGANNIGFKYAIKHKYSYVMMLNNDTVISDTLIQKLVNECNDNQVSVPCMYYYDQPQKIYYAGGTLDKKRGTTHHYGQYDIPLEVNDCFCDFATGCCIMMTTKMISNIGYLDDTYFMYYEDTEYSIRMLKNGIKVKFVAEAKLWHKVGATAGKVDSPIGIYYGSRNRLYLIHDNLDFYSKTALLYTIITRIAYFLRGTIMRKKNSGLYIRAIIDYNRGIKGKITL